MHLKRFPKTWNRRLGQLDTGGIIETIQITVLLRSTGDLKRLAVIQPPSENPPANSAMKNSQGE